MINIRGTILNNDNDPFYRYKMHKPILVTCKNFIAFENIDTVLKDLNREKKLFISFLKINMGINIISKNDSILFPKNIINDELMNSIYKFIEQHVLCPNCKLPETILKNNNIVCNCCCYSGKANIIAIK